MTLGISTSSLRVSVATWDENGIIVELIREAAGAASGAVAEMVNEATSGDLSGLRMLVVDVGPGGFTGVRVGVTFAKSLAWARKVPLATVSAFDLIALDKTVVIPSKRGEWFVRVPGQPPAVLVGEPEVGAIGYGGSIANAVTPNIANALRFGIKLESVDTFSVVPTYIAEPSVSIPKNRHVLKGVVG